MAISALSAIGCIGAAPTGWAIQRLRARPSRNLPERRDRLFEIVGKERGADQVLCLRGVVDLARLGERIPPLPGVEIAAAEPRQGEDLDFLILVESIECGGKLLPRRIVGGGFEDRDLVVVARVRPGIAVDRSRLGVVFARLFDDVAELFERRLEHATVLASTIHPAGPGAARIGELRPGALICVNIAEFACGTG